MCVRTLTLDSRYELSLLNQRDIVNNSPHWLQSLAPVLHSLLLLLQLHKYVTSPTAFWDTSSQPHFYICPHLFSRSLNPGPWFWCHGVISARDFNHVIPRLRYNEDESVPLLLFGGQSGSSHIRILES